MSRSVASALFFLILFRFSLCASAPLFVQTTSLPEPRQKYGTAILGDYIYVLGGGSARGIVTRKVKMARILPDHQLGPWTDTTPLPGARCYINNSTFALDDRLYVIGGSNENTGQYFNTVLWTWPGKDGHLMPWRVGHPFPGPGLDCLTVVSTPGFIHILGGCSGKMEPRTEVWSGRLASDGNVLEWVRGPALPLPLWFHSAATMGGRVWVWGGLTRKISRSTSREVFSAPVLGSGLIGPWRKEAHILPTGVYRGACTAVGNYLITFCTSYSGNVLTNHAYYAQITGNGLSEWAKLETGLPVRTFLGVATDFRRNVLYIPGGRVDMSGRNLVDSRVFYFKVHSPNPTEFNPTPASGEEAMPSGSFAFDKGSGPPSGFVDYQEGMRLMTRMNLPLVCYFHSPWAKKCKAQMEALSGSRTYAFLSKRAVFVCIDITRNPQISQQMGVFRAPVWLFFNRDGSGAWRSEAMLDCDQLSRTVLSLR